MDIQHVMSSQKGGLIMIRHNDLHALTTNILREVCKDIDIEPQLLTATGASFNN